LVTSVIFFCASRENSRALQRYNNKVAAFARRWAGLALTRRNDYVLKFD
jgi:hypothetical protein